MKQMTITGRLFQARMWREYAMAWDGKPTALTGVGREWVQKVLQIPRTECLRRARVNLYLARRMNRQRSNVEVTGAARQHRAAPVLTAGLCSSAPKKGDE